MREFLETWRIQGLVARFRKVRFKDTLKSRSKGQKKGSEENRRRKQRRRGGPRAERTKNILTTALWRANWIEERLQKQGKRKEYNSVSGIEN